MPRAHLKLLYLPICQHTKRWICPPLRVVHVFVVHVTQRLTGIHVVLFQDTKMILLNQMFTVLKTIVQLFNWLLNLIFRK